MNQGFTLLFKIVFKNTKQILTINYSFIKD